jgi:hypothetical protein
MDNGRVTFRAQIPKIPTRHKIIRQPPVAPGGNKIGASFLNQRLAATRATDRRFNAIMRVHQTLNCFVYLVRYLSVQSFYTR